MRVPRPGTGTRGRGPGAFTLVEALVVAALVTTLMLGYSFYRDASQRQSVALDFQASALQSVEVLVSYLQEDFDNLVPGPLTRTFAEPVPRAGVRFHRIAAVSGHAGRPLDPDLQPITEPVEYLFDAAGHRVYRNGQPLRSALFEDVTFTFFPARPQDPEFPPFGDTLIVDLVAVPTEALGRVTERTPMAKHRIELRSPQATVNHTHEEWVGDR